LKEGFENEASYRSSMNETWREGCSERHLIGGSENTAFLLNWGEIRIPN
jgi:hypothetical protein